MSQLTTFVLLKALLALSSKSSLLQDGQWVGYKNHHPQIIKLMKIYSKDHFAKKKKTITQRN